ncbi:hypothetical protein OH807_33755 [Kitasatospora sp. NBC_01560]|uniref:hypothetical protein n=1 Tax=Kitasatospora sp. NBC_01560 TaxID=2975965 RepID=UPI003863160E
MSKGILLLGGGWGWGLVPSAGGDFDRGVAGWGGGGLWCPLSEFDAVGEELADLGGGLVLVAVAGEEDVVLPDLVRVVGEVGGVEGDDESAVVAGAGHGPAAGGHRGPGEFDVPPGTGPLGALALGPLVGLLPFPGGSFLGLGVLGAFLPTEESCAGLSSPALQLHGALAGGLAAAGGFLAAGERGQGLGFVADRPGLGEVGAVVPPDGEHGAAVGGGEHVAVLLLPEEPGGDDQLHHAAAHPAALGVDAGPVGD